MMIRPHDVNIYRGAFLVTSGSRLELGAGSPFLLELLRSLKSCDGCNEAAAIIFPEEDIAEDTLKETFRQLAHNFGARQTGYSIILSK